MPRPDELPASWLAAFGTSATRPTASARRRAPRRTRPAGAPRRDALEVLARPGTHHRDWITARLADELRQLRGQATREAAAAAGFLVAQVEALALADDATDRLAAVLREVDHDELLAAATAGHARARTVRWTLVGASPRG